MNRFAIELMEIDTHHTPNHLVDRPENNMNIWTILCFSTPFIALTMNGLEEGQPGDCFLKSPDFREKHHAQQGAINGFINDWIHVRSTEIQSLLDTLKIPANMILRTGQKHCLRPFMQDIILERNNRSVFYEQKIDNLIEASFIQIARAYHEYNSNSNQQYGKALLQLRNELRERQTESWTVKMMAERIGLSSNRFSVLYKQQFHISPINDLIGMRIERSKLMLLSTNKSLSRIAHECGFQNEYYFSKLFKNHMKIPPGSYRPK